jgi:hypothetical protein
MNLQNAPEPIDRYPLLKRDNEVLRRELLQHTSLASTPEPVRVLKASVSEIVLAPALSIVPEELEEETPVRSPEVSAVEQISRRFKDYSHALVCCRNQLGIGMSNPGPR